MDYFNNNGLLGSGSDSGFGNNFGISSWANGNGSLDTFNGVSPTQNYSFDNSGVTGANGTGSALSNMTGLQMGQLGLGAASGLLSGYLGFQNLALAKQQAAQAQNNWNKQWAANVSTTNASLADRQAARVASNPNAYQGVDAYMKKYGIS